MLRAVIDFNPATGEMRFQGPPNLMMFLNILTLAQFRILQQMTAPPQERPVGIAVPGADDIATLAGGS